MDAATYARRQVEIRKPNDPERRPLDFREEEEAAAEASAIKEREDRNFEINGNGVWLLGYTCALCGNHLMWNGSSTEPHVHCPRCNVRVTKTGLAKMFPGMVTE